MSVFYGKTCQICVLEIRWRYISVEFATRARLFFEIMIKVVYFSVPFSSLDIPPIPYKTRNADKLILTRKFLASGSADRRHCSNVYKQFFPAAKIQ